MRRCPRTRGVFPIRVLTATRARGATLALIALLAGTFALAWALVDDTSSWDVPLYQSYGDQIVDGALPYRDLRVEYPPLAVGAFVLPALLDWHDEQPAAYSPEPAGSARRYALGFGLLMVALLGVAVVATTSAARTLGAGPGGSALAALPLAAAPLLLGDVAWTRFDALPAAGAAVALAAALRGRHATAGMALGLAVAAKLYPVLLLPPLALHAWRRHGGRAAVRTTAAAVASSALCFLPFLAIAPAETASALRSQLDRGLQVESIAGNAVLALHTLTDRLDRAGLPVPVPAAGVDEGGTGEVRSADVTGDTGAVAGTLAGIAGLLVLAALWWQAASRPASARLLVTGAAAAVCVALVTGRVFSPQFLLWLLPLVPLTAVVAGRAGRAATGLLVAATLATNVWFPSLYRDYVNTRDPLTVLYLLGRNAAVVAITIVLIHQLRWTHPRGRAAGGASGQPRGSARG